MNGSRVSGSAWRKSSRSNDPDTATCVELAAIDDRRAVRDSTDPEGPRLSLSVSGLRRLVQDIKVDKYDL